MENRLIPNDLSKKILTVGPSYLNHRGGIGAVLETYNGIYQDFKFIPTYQVYGNNLKKALFFITKIAAIIKALIADKDIKIIHIHGSHRGSFYRKLLVFYIAKNIFKKRVIYHLHSSSFDLFYKGSNALQKKLISKMISGADLIICLSPWWKNFYETTFNCRSIKIINNVVNERENTDIPAVKSPAATLNLLFLGRIGDRKGIFDLVEVIANDKQLFEGRIKLWIGGDGEIDRLQQLIKEKQLENIVEYIGWVTKDKKTAYLAQADIYILPSYNEGLPISILESMSYGLPIISTTIGGIPEIVENNVNGFIFEPGNKTEISNSIKYFLDHPQQIIAFGNASLLKIQNYLPDNVAKQLRACYHDLLPNEM